METEGLKGEFDRTQATQTLETTLDKLLDHLEEKNVQEPEQQTPGRSGDPPRDIRNRVPKQPGYQVALPYEALSISVHVGSTSAMLIFHPYVQLMLLSTQIFTGKFTENISIDILNNYGWLVGFGVL